MATRLDDEIQDLIRDWGRKVSQLRQKARQADGADATRLTEKASVLENCARDLEEAVQRTTD